MTVHMELTEDQAIDLRDLLQASISDLSTEIAGTDNPAYREGLRSRRTSLESVLAKLRAAA